MTGAADPSLRPGFHLKVSAHSLREIRLVDDEQVGLRDARAPFPRDLVPTRHVDHVDDIVRELPAVVSREVVLGSTGT